MLPHRGFELKMAFELVLRSPLTRFELRTAFDLVGASFSHRKLELITA